MRAGPKVCVQKLRGVELRRQPCIPATYLFGSLSRDVKLIFLTRCWRLCSLDAEPEIPFHLDFFLRSTWPSCNRMPARSIGAQNIPIFLGRVCRRLCQETVKRKDILLRSSAQKLIKFSRSWRPSYRLFTHFAIRKLDSRGDDANLPSSTLAPGKNALLYQIFN